MRKQHKKVVQVFICCIVLVSFVGCSVPFDPEEKTTILSSSVKSAVSKVIDEEMECIKPNLDPELQASIDGYSKGKPLNGAQIVELTLEEESGSDYVDFCFEVQRSGSGLSSEDVLSCAQSMIPEKEFSQLQEKVVRMEKGFEDFAETYIKAIPTDQQQAFYQDLKELVVRSVVLLTAGVVYAVMPQTVFWGKVSAAAAISIGAGMVAITVMTIYEYFKFDNLDEFGQEKTFEDWLKELLAVPKAEFALTTAVTSLGNSLGKGPVVTGIIMCAFGLYKATDMIVTMLQTYNFDA